MTAALTFDGAFTALVTPFRGGEVDRSAFDRLLSRQLDAGITGVVPCGTTGESPTLSPAESAALIEHTVRQVSGRALVIAGTGTNATAESIEKTRAASRAGADAAMIVMPYYNRPTQRGLVEHVRAVHDATDLPLVLYNIPSRTGSDVSTESLIEIVRTCPRVVALKESSGNVVRTQQVVAALGSRLAVLAGDDALTLAVLACGGRGVVSVTSNVVPDAVVGVVRAFHAGDFSEARRRHFALLPLHEALFTETNPGPVKAALALRHEIAAEIRLPLVWPTEQSMRVVRAALEAWSASPTP